MKYFNKQVYFWKHDYIQELPESHRMVDVLPFTEVKKQEPNPLFQVLL